MFDTVFLRSFVTVVQEGGFTRAANRLHLTQSAISAHLRRLEEQAGKTLLFRTTRSVTLTADGELLMGAALTALAQAGSGCRIAMVCPSSAGLRAAALAGFAVVPAVRGQLGHGLQALTSDPRLPALPNVEFTGFVAPGTPPATADAICHAVLSTVGALN